jgi:hypothetical protein
VILNGRSSLIFFRRISLSEPPARPWLAFLCDPLANGGWFLTATTHQHLRAQFSFLRQSPQSARVAVLLVSGLALSLPAWLSAQPLSVESNALPAASSLPSAPVPQDLPAFPQQAPTSPPTLDPCTAKNTGATMAATGAMRALDVLGLTERSPAAAAMPVLSRVCVPHLPIINWYARFLTGPQVKPLTPLEKAHLAAHNVIDPFNLITILGVSAISVAANSHSAYGPGMRGYRRYVGVSLAQDMTGEFFGTFLIPSIAHQDPHYHRMPNASITRRVFHAFDQIVWTQGDNGEGMVNYAILGGFAIDGAISNLYVPGQRDNLPSSVARYFIGLGTAPVGNFVDEFLPDIARHIHIQVVIIQRIINQISINNSQ